MDNDAQVVSIARNLLAHDNSVTFRKGRIYFVDDLLPQSNWPSDHGGEVTRLIEELDSREGVTTVKLEWGLRLDDARPSDEDPGLVGLQEGLNKRSGGQAKASLLFVFHLPILRMMRGVRNQRS